MKASLVRGTSPPGTIPPRIFILRTQLALIALGVALALAGCGGSSNQAAQPQLPRAIAEALASRSDAIADALDAGDTCKAALLADGLKTAVDSALAGGQVPPAFQGQLERTATDLQNEVNCVAEHHDNGKGNGKDREKHGETTTIGTTTSIPTTTGPGG